jgi:hypothetical protein
MFIHLNTVDIDLKIVVFCQVNIFHFRQGTLLICASQLNVTSIFPQAKTKSKVLNETLVVVCLVDGLKVVAEGLGPHAEDAVCILRIKKIGFLFGTAEGVLDTILAFVIRLSKIYLISYDVAIVVTPLYIPLIELTLVPVGALTFVFTAAQQFVRGRLSVIKPAIYMVSTGISVAVLFAGNCCNRAACVHNQSLRMALTAYVNSHIEVL